MKQIGLRGIAMLLAYSLLAWLLIRWGGNWETTARVMTAILAGILGLYGVYFVVAAANAKPQAKCHVETCSEDSKRNCDFVMWNGDTCGWPCCYQHISISGKREYCETHYRQEGLV